MTESRRTQVSGLAVDAGAAVVTVVAVFTGSALLGDESVHLVPLGSTLGALLLLRRRWPVAVLLLSVCTIISYRTAELVNVGWLWPVVLAYAGAVVAGRLRWAVGLGLTEVAFAASWESTHRGGDEAGAVAGLGVEALLLAAVIAAAHAYRSWRRWQDEVALRVRAAADEQQAEAGRRRAEERLRIARELHDLVAHTLAVVGVHLNVAADALDTAPDEARGALLLARQVRGKAMSDLNALINVLRDGSTGQIEPPAADLSSVDELVALVRETGLRVTLDAPADLAGLPAPVALAGYRIAQEALTNAVRHSGAERATVTVKRGVDEVTVSIVDQGRGPAPELVPGHGISGITERAAALGGTLSYGPAPAGGFAVVAVLPLGRGPR